MQKTICPQLGSSLKERHLSQCDGLIHVRVICSNRCRLIKLSSHIYLANITIMMRLFVHFM